MVAVMLSMAGALALIGLYAIVTGLERPYSGATELSGLTIGFVAMFVVSAWLFRRAEEESRGE